MKLLKTFVAVALVLVLSSATIVKEKDRGVYLFGISSSFTDTIAYFTTIQQLDTVKLTKGGVLPFLPNYSSQLENYVEVMKLNPNQTGTVIYSTNKKKIEKDRTKLLNRYKKKMSHQISIIPIEEFTFSPINPE